MAGTLFVVATPIGHLEDITVRALRILREVAVVAAEDTRRTGNLLRHFDIPTRVLSLHAHNERSRAPELLALLERGESIAIVSDAGTPGISDPGSDLVRQARERGVRIEPVPGASAVSAAISVSGLQNPAFAFLGFPPVRPKDRKRWFSKVARLHGDTTVVMFEAPHRVRKTLAELSALVKRPILVFRELTKVHEETLHGLPADLVNRVQAPQGEFTLVIPESDAVPAESAPVAVEELRRLLGEITENAAISRREAARTLAQRFGLSTKHVYEVTRTQE